MTDVLTGQPLELSMGTVVRADEAAISTDLEGETVILDTNKGVYYGLDAVGTFIWGLIQRPVPLSEVRDAVLGEYDVDAATCERDLVALVRKLSAGALVRIEGPARP